MQTSVEKRYIRFYLHYSKGKKTISHIKYILRKKRASRTKLKANIINEKIARILHNDSIMGSKNDTYCTESELIRGYVAPSYKELSVDEQIMYDKQEIMKAKDYFQILVNAYITQELSVADFQNTLQHYTKLVKEEKL